MIFDIINMHGNVDEKPVNYYFNCLCAGLWKGFSHVQLLLFSSLPHVYIVWRWEFSPRKFGSCKSLGLKSASAICGRWGIPQVRTGPHQATWDVCAGRDCYLHHWFFICAETASTTTQPEPVEIASAPPPENPDLTDWMPLCRLGGFS